MHVMEFIQEMNCYMSAAAIYAANMLESASK